MQFDIHSMDKIAPEFIRSILAIDSLGYDCDYISDKQLQNVTVKDGRIVTPANTQYKALIIPSGATLNEAMKKQLEALAPYVIYGEDDSRMQQFAEPEAIRRTHRLRAIRRKNDEGYHYFIANLTPNDVNDTVRIAVDCKAALWYNPMNGKISRATVTPEGIHMALRSGESLILKTLNDGSQILPAIKESCNKNETITLDNPWTLTFTEEQPAIAESFTLTAPQTWEALTDSTRVMMGTGIYTTTVTLNKSQAAGSWQIDLGDVRESARVYINDTFIGCAWAVPFTLDCGKTLRQGDNVIRIEVTNLPANRIADYDRRNIPWRKMKEINVVDINYKKTTYGNWKPMKSGLNSQVRLVSK
ncbi:MAG: glycosyl hydrolase family 2, partial [Prevotella sp.]|nr:glycosyl hydrolase family 2 [Prevotella sp.]